MNDEKALLERIKQGDEQAFRQFMAIYKKRAYLVAFGLTGNHHDAVALSQEAFTKAYFSIKEFHGKSSLYTWFYRILVNLCLRHNQRQRKWPRLFFTSDRQEARSNPDAISLEAVSDLDSRRFNPLNVLLHKELSRRIDEAIQSLPEYQRTVFVLHQLDGLSIKEIAQILGCRAGTVKSHFYRAVQKLRRLLLPYVKADK